MIDIRFTNRWVGFSREEIMLFHQGIKWFTAGKCEDFKELMDEMWAEVIRRDDSELAVEADGEEKAGKAV